MNMLNINFELPEFIAEQAGLDLNNINKDVKQMFALFLYEHKRISLSKACEISGMTQWEFFELNSRLGLPIHYTKNNLEKDMERLSNV